MEIKVYIEGVLREVCGVTDSTTCEEIIVKLAQAANLPGFYTLVALNRGQEITLSADEKVVDFFQKIRGSPVNIHFVLRRLEARPNQVGTANQVRVQHAIHRPQPRHATTTVTLPQSSAGSISQSRGPLSPPPPSSQIRPRPPDRNRTPPHQDHRPPIRTPEPETDAYSSEYEQLQDQLAYQEREVEVNRMRLVQLDKDISEMERTQHMNASSIDSSLAVGVAAELSQLATMPWSQLLESNQRRQRDLLKERDHYKLTVEKLDADLAQIRTEATQLEAQVKSELDRLVSTLDIANHQRRQFLRSLSPTSSQSRRNTAARTDGVPV